MPRLCIYRRFSGFATLIVFALTGIAGAQSVGNSGSVDGTVTDTSGAVIPKAKVEIRNPVSGYDRSTTTDSAGRFAFTNVPFNPYHLTITVQGFSPFVEDVEPRSSVPVTVAAKLTVANETTSVTVEGWSVIGCPSTENEFSA